MTKKPKVAVLMGGSSAEREISMLTGQKITEALIERGYETVQIDLDGNVVASLEKSGCDIVFIALHGSPGEDGTIQGMLEILGIPYVGSGVLASSVGIDKIRSKMLFSSVGIPAPFHLPVKLIELENGVKQLIQRLVGSLGLPMVVKPATTGSALGVEIVKEETQIEPALRKALSFGREVIAEEFISGTEITVGLLGSENPRALPAIEIVSETDFYDYEAKYTPGKSRHIIPPRVSKEVLARAERYAVAAHVGLGCRDFSRVDFVVDKEDEMPYILEINTIPGMTPLSLFPEAAKSAGIEFNELIETLVKFSQEHGELPKSADV